MAARGDPSSLWLLLVGLTRSTDRSRVPPLKHHIWRMVANKIFDAGSYVINMTDGATCYSQQVTGVYEHFSVNHQLKEWTRPVDATFNVETGEKHVTLASTNFKDSEWQKLNSQLPRGLSVKTKGEIRTKMNYVRSAQWRMMIRGEEPWAAFCQAAVAWKQEHASEAAGVEEELRRSGDDPGEDDVAEELDGGIYEADAGAPGPPYGFEATGERELLMAERRARAELLKEGSDAVVAAPAASNWDAEDTSETEESGEHEYGISSDGASRPAEPKRGCFEAEGGPSDGEGAADQVWAGDEEPNHEEIRLALEQTKSALCVRFQEVAPESAWTTTTRMLSRTPSRSA